MKPYIIGIAGGSASGKTTLTSVISSSIHEYGVSIIDQDNYYKDRSKLPIHNRSTINYDHPDAVDTDILVEHLRVLKNGGQIESPLYDFTTHTRRHITKSVSASDVIILDGLLLMHTATLRKLIDLKIFVDTEADLRLLRRLQRDTVERGRSVESVISQYIQTVRPMHIKFVAPQKKHSNIVIEGDRVYSEDFIENVLSKIRRACCE